MSETRAPRRVAIETMVDAAKKLRAGRYHAISGAANWTAWDFESRPYGCAVMTDQVRFRRHDGQAHADVSIEFCCRWPDTDGPLSNEDLTDELEEDALALIRAVETGFDGRGDRVATVGASDTQFVTFSDADLQVMGIVVQFEIHY